MHPTATTARSKHPLLLIALALTAFALLFAGTGGAATRTAATNCASSEFTSEFFNNTDLSGLPVVTRCDAAVNFDWGSGSPDPAVNNDHFTARFTGQQNFTAGWYSFDVTVDDMFRLYVDGQLVLDTWGRAQAPTGYSAVREMTAGAHTVVVEYGEIGGGAVIRYSATPTSAPPATFQFSAPAYSVYEHAGTATFIVIRTGDTSNVDSVSYATVQASNATAGTDYVDTSGTLTFAPGVTSETFTVAVIDDLAVEGDEYFSVNLSGSSSRIGSPASASVRIIDNDARPGDGNQTDLAITQSGSPDPTTVSQNTAYQLTITNNSLWTATNVSVLDTLPADSTLVSSPGCADNTDGTVTCAQASLAPDATATFTVTVRTTGVGAGTNTAVVGSDTPDSDISDNSSSETTTVVAAAPPATPPGTPPVAPPAPPDTPPTAPPAPPVAAPVPPLPAASPCKLTLTSDYIFQSLITYVGIRVTRDDVPVQGVAVYSRPSYAGEITNTRTDALGYVEYHFGANSPLQSVEFVAGCDGNGPMTVSARDLGLLTTRNVSQIGSYVGQGQRTPKTQANCGNVSVSASRLQVGKAGSVTVEVSFANQPVKAGGVVLFGAGIYEVKATRRAGEARFLVRPTRTGTLYVRVPNFAACDYVAALPVR